MEPNVLTRAILENQEAILRVLCEIVHAQEDDLEMLNIKNSLIDRYRATKRILNKE